jgi:hypothetical protein
MTVLRRSATPGRRGTAAPSARCGCSRWVRRRLVAQGEAMPAIVLTPESYGMKKTQLNQKEKKQAGVPRYIEGHQSGRFPFRVLIAA